MVAIAHHCNSADNRCDTYIWRRKRSCTIHLYIILNMNREKISETILTITVGFIVLHLVFGHNLFLTIAVTIGITGIVSSYLSEKIAILWYKLAELLGYVVPKILLGLVFFVFLYPISLLAKLGKKDHLMLSRKYVSYFVDRVKKIDKSDFDKTW
jgi:hypothetical protein